MRRLATEEGVEYARAAENYPWEVRPLGNTGEKGHEAVLEGNQDEENSCQPLLDRKPSSFSCVS